MPTKSEIRKMSKPQLVDFACDFFEDEGNLRQQMEALSKPQLVDLLFEHEAWEEPESRISPVPEVAPPPPRGPLDLGTG
jgi:hypothetical protein